MTIPAVQVKELKIGNEYPVRIMGVINLSPESFYKGSIAINNEQVIELVRTYEIEGADIIDVGAASSSPLNVYSRKMTSVEEEYKRVSEFLSVIVESTSLPVSIDTTSAEVAEKALNLGAAVVNDISGLRADKRMGTIITEYSVPVILMANCKNACDSVQKSLNALRNSLNTANNAGIEDDRIIVDPGIGFGKLTEADIRLLQKLRAFKAFEKPVLVGISRKAFLGEILELPNPDDRLLGTIAATTICVTNGANVIRTHDVKEALVASKIGQRLRRKNIKSNDLIELYHIQDYEESEAILEQIGVSPKIKSSLAQKSIILNVVLRNLKIPAALIIKQEMLALGGDAAYHHDTIDFGVDSTDVLIMGTRIQLKRLCHKMKTMDYFRLDKISDSILGLLDEHGEL